MNNSTDEGTLLGGSGSNASLVGMVVAISFLAVAIFSGNLLVIVSVAVNRRLQNKTSVFITSLAVGDLLISLAVVPLIVLSNVVAPMMEYSRGIRYCHAAISVTISLMFNSVSNLSAISLDRYLAIETPLHYRAFTTKRRVSAIVAFVWVFSTTVGFIPYMGWRKVRRPEPGGLFCQVPFNLDKNYIIAICIAATIPGFFMLVAYYKILQTAKDHSSRIACAMNNIMQNYSRRSKATIDFLKEAKAAKMVVLVLGSFLICWTPLFCIMIFDVIKENYINSFVYAGAVMFATVNSAFNPAIYAAMNSEFRNTFKSILQCKRPTRIVVPH
ncbi:predicted protein [Nematostella vectensis]|uniref:G-protein coupled receptors family 1 profile domain-containing protein n=1 Tax=Nematostella vectensis TaxID=45351 RepID=A7SF51_NEMVE|nr:predicted protein [Nematostella vectensis]|eukprot:XP_001629710.1 predicted protein [Nematostella vectensis]